MRPAPRVFRSPLLPCAVVGDFRQLITVSVFRTETVPEALVRQGLTQESGYATCVEPQARQDSTMRFQLLRSEVSPPAPGSSPEGTPGGAGGQAYEFEFRWARATPSRVADASNAGSTVLNVAHTRCLAFLSATHQLVLIRIPMQH